MKRADLQRRLARRAMKDPYEGLPTDELDEPVLPRWFVLLALVTVPVAVVVFLIAFLGFGRDEIPVAERRPPPAGGLTSDVGDLVVGQREPVPHEPRCEAVDGFWVAGTELDRSLLGTGLDVMCDAPAFVRDELAALGAQGAAVRFAAFEATGVDVTGNDGLVYVNARFSQTPGELIGPLLAYQAVVARGDPAEAATVIAAREAELAACDTVLEERTRACEDAAELLRLDDPAAALREAGFE